MNPLRLPATLDALEEIGNYVIEAARQAGLDQKASYALRLAVDEIATNVITHGYEEAGTKGDITIVGEITDAALTVTLTDQGVPFDPLSHRLPEEDDLALPLEERQIGGLGIMLVINGVDAFSYRYENGSNLNVFAMNRRSFP